MTRYEEEETMNDAAFEEALEKQFGQAGLERQLDLDYLFRAGYQAALAHLCEPMACGHSLSKLMTPEDCPVCAFTRAVNQIGELEQELAKMHEPQMTDAELRQRLFTTLDQWHRGGAGPQLEAILPIVQGTVAKAVDAALWEAAKAQCFACQRELVLTREIDDAGIVYFTHEQKFNGSNGCRATAIHHLREEGRK